MKEIRTEISISASPGRVWAVLAAGPDWGAWNPFIVRVEGALSKGAHLKCLIQAPGSKPMGFASTVLVADPAKELRWVGRLLVPGLFDGEHYFLLEPDQGGTRLIHGERFTGLLTGLVAVERFEAGFAALNQGLKQRAEAA